MSKQKTPSKALNISLWIAQVLLAAMFIMAGLMKSTQPIEELSKNLPWVNNGNVGLVRFIGVAELLGGIGLLLPSILRIKPPLTYWAALGIATIMVFAIIYHVMHVEYGAVGITILLAALAVFIAWGRYNKAAIAPRGQQVRFS